MKLHELEEGDLFVFSARGLEEFAGIFLGCDGMYGKIFPLTTGGAENKQIGGLLCNTEVKKFELPHGVRQILIKES